jgi:prepilin-type N-terminal cleavage/methylation domain-containing protein
MGGVFKSDRVHGRQSDELGFTLIELLIVIVVLGILSAVTVFTLSGTAAQSAVAACNADAKTVDVAVAAYDAQTGYSGSGTVPPAPTAALLVPTYLQTFPASGLYTIGLTSTGAVTVAAPPSATPVLYDTNDTCGNLGGSSSSTSAVVASSSTAAPSTTASPSTTAAPTTTATSSTTAAPTTTTTAPGNGVTVTASVPSNASPYQEELSLANLNAMPSQSLSITITVAQTGGLAGTGCSDTFQGNAVQDNCPAPSLTYNYLQGNGAIGAGKGGNVYASFSGPAHATSGDTWTVTSTSGGITSTLTGHF